VYASEANYLPPLVLRHTLTTVAITHLKGVVLKYRNEFTTTVCSEAGNTTPSTHRMTASTRNIEPNFSQQPNLPSFTEKFQSDFCAGLTGSENIS
jgi:hypothetical protein